MNNWNGESWSKTNTSLDFYWFSYFQSIGTIAKIVLRELIILLKIKKIENFISRTEWELVQNMRIDFKYHKISTTIQKRNYHQNDLQFFLHCYETPNKTLKQIH